MKRYGDTYERWMGGEIKEVMKGDENKTDVSECGFCVGVGHGGVCLRG